MKGYLDVKELENCKKEDLQELAKAAGRKYRGDNQRTCYTLRRG